MNKPTKPNIVIPESFAENGIKADFDNEKLTNGFDRLQPDVLAGDNLNKLIDDTYKGLNYAMAGTDAVNLIQENETLTVKNGEIVSGKISNLPSSRIYDSGVSTDTEGYEKVRDLKHSQFDLSKVTVIGSPQITNDGIASEFSSTSYLTKTLDFRNASSWKVCIGFTTPSSVSSTVRIIQRSASHTSFLGIALLTSGISSFIQLAGTPYNAQTVPFQANTRYMYELSYDNGIVTIKYKKESDDTYTTLLSQSTEYVWDSESLHYIGNGSNTTEYYTGSIDLKQFSITVDGVEVFNCLKTGVDTVEIDGVSTDIPYTESKTGAKIVNATYRDRVEDWYEQSGEGNYYTIDEENKNFTLPLPDLYGLIENKAPEIVYW